MVFDSVFQDAVVAAAKWKIRWQRSNPDVGMPESTAAVVNSILEEIGFRDTDDNGNKPLNWGRIYRELAQWEETL